jgi:NADH-quinone oxidoreductase subunit J
MPAVFTIIALITLASAVAAMSLRNLVHCALCAALSFAGLAAVFLELNAQFVGLAQILVYVGAVAILIVFAILLTRGSEPTVQPIFGRSWWIGLGIAGLVWGSLAMAVLLSPLPVAPAKSAVEVTSAAAVRPIGLELMTTYVLPLEIMALLLTAATIGAVIIAMPEKDLPK